MPGHPAPDRDEIVATVQLYFDGFIEGSAEKFRRCFHPDAWIVFTELDGELHAHLIADAFEDWASSEGPCEGTFISVLQAGDVARVLLEMHWPNDPVNDAWVDIHSLLRIDGVWVDTNKTATHASRAGWAGAVPARGEEAAEAPDRDEILQVVQLYIDGFNEGSVEKFERAFHEEAWMFCTEPDGHEQYNTRIKGDEMDGWASEPGDRISGRILSVTQAGDVASVLLGFDNRDDASNCWVDHHSLLKINGTWKITNKTATHSSRAAWAASERGEYRTSTPA
jgi:hypothetical protein